MQIRHAGTARATIPPPRLSRVRGRASGHAARPARKVPAGDRRGPVIVVGYDATPEARQAFAFAVGRAGPYGSVVAVHAVARAPGYLGRPYYDRAVERAHRDGRAVLAELAATGECVVETSLVEGAPAEVLARVARVRNAREIVVGARKLGRVRAALSSVSRQLATKVDRPVVLVPSPRA